VLAHHDSAHSGVLFHPGISKWMYEKFPERVEKAEESLPYWIASVTAPALVAAGGALGLLTRGRRGRLVTRLGTLLSAAGVALALDIARSPVVPGANDNLSAVAVLVHLARALRERPVQGLRVLLVSCGSEESLQEGILAYARRHFAGLPPASTSFLVVDTVGSPSLVLIEAEGTLRMRRYSERLKDLLAGLAAEHGIELRRGLRLRSSTDATIPNRHGYPTALLASMNRYRAASNYHWPTDTAANVDYGSVADCAVLAEGFARKLAAGA
jgi:Zn-dependent M28 family amino/carboxypeptidase